MGDHELIIEAVGVGETGKYVQSVELDGLPLDVPTLTHQRIVGTLKMKFVMSGDPTSWGRN